MLDTEQLTLAIDIQSRTYKLLLWLENAIQSGFVSLDSAHHYGSAVDAAHEWILRHYENLPLECRPDQAHLDEFANFFGSYLDTSFDLVSRPGAYWKSDGSCCACAFCQKVANARHLRPKAITPQDRKRAAKLRVRRVGLLAQNLGLGLSDEVVKRIANGSLLREAAFSAYGASLLERVKGIGDGHGVLVLWREIAWSKGSPNKSFRLRARDFIESEQRLVAALKDASSAHLLS